jgi:D-alanyl-D-alanine carboxypeptidase
VPTPPPSAPPAPDYSRPGGIYLDILTARRAYADWATSLLDTIYMLPPDYHPGDLVDSGAAGLNGGYPIRAIVLADLRAMVDAARAAGAPLAVVSGFRSHAQQITTFNHWVTVSGYGAALRTSARPGHSEHQLGTTLDFTSLGGGAPWEYADWATTPAGGWMRANAWRYGFVMSYPAGSYAHTGYDYEPWHYRYVGRDLAATIQASGLTPRGYLWATR